MAHPSMPQPVHVGRIHRSFTIDVSPLNSVDRRHIKYIVDRASGAQLRGDALRDSKVMVVLNDHVDADKVRQSIIDSLHAGGLRAFTL